MSDDGEKIGTCGKCQRDIRLVVPFEGGGEAFEVCGCGRNPGVENSDALFEIKREVPDPIEQWAIVELMGRHQTAGRISEDTTFGTSMLQLDIPQGSGFVRQFLNPNQSIFRMTVCSEEIAREISKTRLEPDLTLTVEKMEDEKALRAADDLIGAGSSDDGGSLVADGPIKAGQTVAITEEGKVSAFEFGETKGA